MTVHAGATSASPVAVTPSSAPGPAVFKRVAVCIRDGDDLAALLPAVRALAARRRAQVLVLHAAGAAEEAADRLVGAAVQRLRRSGIRVAGKVVTGAWPAASLLLVAAERFRADLLVTGTRGLRGLDAVLEESFSHAVLQRSPCPVLAVPAHARRLGLQRALVAWDGSEAAVAALAVARRLERVHGTHTDVLHASGDVAEAVASAADDLHAGLVVMGTRGRSELGALVLGSVSHQLLAQSSRPLLLVRAEDHGGGRPWRPRLVIC